MQTPLKETPAAPSSSGLFKLAPRRSVVESCESPARAAAQACCGGTPQGSLAAVTRLPGNAGTVAISFDWGLRQLDKPERTSGPALAPLLDQRLTMQLYTVAAEVAVTSWAAGAAVVPLSLKHQSVTLPDATNLSGTAAGIAPTATWTIVPHLRAYAGAQLPIWRSLNGTQLVGAYSVLAGALVSFSAWGGG